MLTAAALAFAVNLAGAVFNWVFQKAGRLTTQVVIFALALLAAVYYQYFADIPSVSNAVQIAIVIFSMAVSFYEVLLKYSPVFSGPKDV